VALTQQLPQAPWFFTGVTTFFSRQSMEAGGSTSAYLKGVAPLRSLRLHTPKQKMQLVQHKP
jgi:hypothetical protein